MAVAFSGRMEMTVELRVSFAIPVEVHDIELDSPSEARDLASDKVHGTYLAVYEDLLREKLRQLDMELQELRPLNAELVEAQEGENVEACPGCGCEPGDGVTEGCNHPHGCGYLRDVEDDNGQS